MRSSPRSSAGPLAWAYTALVLYASLYPFGPWRWPPGNSALAFLVLPWPPWRDPFDVASNLLGYLPLGALLYVAGMRLGRRGLPALLRAALPAALLSYSTELIQTFLPGRHPSAVDWALNTAGAGLGVGLAWALHRLGVLQRWQVVREHWFVRDSAGAVALLALWPVGLLFPAPVPLGLGHVGSRLGVWAAEWLDETDWVPGLKISVNLGHVLPERLAPFSDGLVQLLGLLAPCLLAFCVARSGWRRGALVLGALTLGFAATTLSTALSFGPEHALAWVTPLTPLAWSLALLLAALLAGLPPKPAAAFGLVVLTALVVLVVQAPADPYFAQSLQAWEQGRFIRFNGLALWVGWLWPYAAMGWMLLRLSSRE